MSKNVNLALLGTLDTTTPEQFLVSTGPDTTPNFQNISLLPSGNTNFIAGSGVTLNQSGNTAQYSQLTCPQWHIGQTGKMLARESAANRISQQVSLSANFLRHLQYIVSLNPPVTGAEILTTPTGAFPGIDAHDGGVLLTDGRVFCVPGGGTVARIYNPFNDTLTTPSGTYPGSDAVDSGVLLTDGRVYCIAKSGTISLIYNPFNNTLTTPNGTFPGVQGAHEGGVLLPDGRVFCVPAASTVARIYNPFNDTLTTPAGPYPNPIGSYPNNVGWAGAVSLPDGRVYCVPHNSTIAIIYNPFNDTLITPNGTFPGATTQAHQGGHLLPDGRVFCRASVGSISRIYDPISNILTTPAGTYLGGSVPYQGSALLPDGRIFCVPHDSTVARIYDPATNTLTTPSGTYPGVQSYDGGVVMQDGRVYCVPRKATIARIIKICNNVNFSTAVLTGPQFNKYD